MSRKSKYFGYINRDSSLEEQRDRGWFLQKEAGTCKRGGGPRTMKTAWARSA